MVASQQRVASRGSPSEAEPEDGPWGCLGRLSPAEPRRGADSQAGWKQSSAGSGGFPGLQGHSKTPGVPQGIPRARQPTMDKSTRVTKMSACSLTNRADTVGGGRNHIYLCALKPLVGFAGDSGLGLKISRQKGAFEASGAPIGKGISSSLPQRAPRQRAQRFSAL